MAFNPKDHFEINPQVKWKQVEDQLILLNVRSGSYFTLNETARLIWECIDKKQPFEKIVEAVMEEYEAPKDEVLEDVTGTIENFIEEELLTKGEDA